MIPVSKHRPNSRPLTLFSDNEQKHDIEIVYDLGTKDNWMSAKTVRDMGFMTKMPDRDRKPLVDFNNMPLVSVGVVQAKWLLPSGKLEGVKFRVTENGPFQALFGYDFLLEKGLVTINDDEPDSVLISKGDQLTEGA